MCLINVAASIPPYLFCTKLIQPSHSTNDMLLPPMKQYPATPPSCSARDCLPYRIPGTRAHPPGQQQACGVGGSVVCEPKLDAELLQLLALSGRDNHITSHGSIGYLADHLGVGEPHHKPVLGGVVPAGSSLGHEIKTAWCVHSTARLCLRKSACKTASSFPRRSITEALPQLPDEK